MLRFWVAGDPACKGSAKAYVRNGRAIVTNDCKREKPWSQVVHWTAREMMTEQPYSGPVRVVIELMLPRPKRLGKRVGVPHDRRPDLDKLVRSCLDALTGIAFIDDGQVHAVYASKFYADAEQPSGAYVQVMPEPIPANCKNGPQSGANDLQATRMRKDEANATAPAKPPHSVDSGERLSEHVVRG